LALSQGDGSRLVIEQNPFPTRHAASTDPGSMTAALGPAGKSFHSVKADIHSVWAEYYSVKTDIHSVRAECHSVKADIHSVKADIHSVKAEYYSV
jgi:hypothetical protein